MRPVRFMQGSLEKVRIGLQQWSGIEADYLVIATVSMATFALAWAWLPHRSRYLRHRNSARPLARWKPVRPLAQTWKRRDISDPRMQMEVVARVEFEPQRLLNHGEYQLLLLIESVVRGLDAGLRVMAQTSMGEILQPRKGSASSDDCHLAYRSINSKRLDFLVVDAGCTPVLAIEYQGAGHYRSRSFMRDAVKREALRKANIEFLEVRSDYDTAELKRHLRRLLLRGSRI